MELNEAWWQAGRVTEPITPEPAAVGERAAAIEARATSETVLLFGGERWIREALDAWAEDDQAKVAVMAPMAVELLGKATLWRENPVLLVQLNDKHEATLFDLATSADLSARGVKTIGLRIVMDR